MHHLQRRLAAGGWPPWLGVFLLLAATASPAGEQPPPPQGGSQAPAKPDRRAADPQASLEPPASQPGPDHRWLDPLVGSWQVELRQQDAAGAEVRLAGASENRWILDGRFLRCELSAGEGTSSVEATTIYGFDERQRRHFAVRIHNRSTSFVQLWGSYDPAARSFLLSGGARDATGALLMYREVLKVDGPDRHVLSLYQERPRRPAVKVAEAVFTRR